MYTIVDLAEVIGHSKLKSATTTASIPQPTELQCLVSDFKSCFLSVKAWMLSNKLKLNDEKTEAMLVGAGPLLRGAATARPKNITSKLIRSGIVEKVTVS